MISIQCPKVASNREMNIEEALEIVESAIEQGHLNRVQEIVFRQSWEGKSYTEIARSSGYEAGYVRDAGCRLWQVLSRAFGKKVTKNNLHGVLKKEIDAVAHATQTYCSYAPEWQQAQQPVAQLMSMEATTGQYQDWADAVDVSIFYNRTAELATLQQWVVKERCRLVTIFGMGGIGKTALVVKLAQQVQDNFQYLIWRSLRNTPLLKDLIAELIQFHFQGQHINLADTASGRILQLMTHLRSSRCLLILDNVESILQLGNHIGCYQAGYEDYGQLFRCMAETPHSSCLMLTSREKPRSLTAKEGEKLPVRSLRLAGLDVIACREIFRARGEFLASESEWSILIQHYAGNPLVLKMVAPVIQDFFDCSISKFLLFIKQNTFIFGDIRYLFDQQFNRLANLEKELLYFLAVKQNPVPFSELIANFAPTLCRTDVIVTLASLQQRSLIEKVDDGFTLLLVVKRYFINKMIEEDRTETISQEIDCFNEKSLNKLI